MRLSINKIAALVIIFIIIVMALKIPSVDRTAKRYGDGLYWKDVNYIAVGDNYTTPKNDQILAEDQNGGSVIGFGEDNQHTYLMVDSFLDQRLFVREDYVPNDNGPLTAVALRGALVKSVEYGHRIKLLLEESKKARSKNCKFNNINELSKVEYSYNDSRVTDFFAGYISFHNGAWVYVRRLNDDSFMDLYHRKNVNVECYEITDPHKVLTNNH
ncbi:hypothetical protein BS333_15050 [Vibrio azureus]|uniref:Uncharacterized protein n=1 Tax=Vibrio azureus NBRC 104587 TaxID=1219077 RepID=U3CE80_9VIBR|nr:hypothetical protein [Vibrio azureus]AUI87720.1 hypothetical protein BS333_15050 [Vibrio azureus]GAD76628.1 hypothetical protein VAZ01S_048_00350 [Vibrio azureus NBRC 104587]